MLPNTHGLAPFRFAVVALVELIALGICYLPLRRREEQWQIDCRKIGTRACITVLVWIVLELVVIILGMQHLGNVAAIWLIEYGIALIYLLNVVSLMLVIARTGGPATSLYGTLIPIQLSAMLFLQLERGIGFSVLYAVIGTAGYLAAHYLKARISALKVFAPDPPNVDLVKQNASWAVALTVGAMVLSFVTYIVPADKRLVSFVNQWYVGSSIENPVEKK